MTYRGFEIEVNAYGKGECTVDVYGDDVWCATLEEAKATVDDIIANERG